MGFFYNRRHKRGVAFVEVIVSLLLLGITAGAIIGAFLIGSISAARVKHRITAINLAREKIEAIKGKTFALIEIGTEIEPSVVIDPGAPRTGDELNGQRITTIDGTSEKYRVTVSVTWAETYVSNVLEEKVMTLISQR